MSNADIHYVVATHGKLSLGFENAVALLTQHHDIHPITAYLEDEFPDNLEQLMKGFKKEDYIVVFTDVACGSVTQKILELYGGNEHLFLFSGVNLSLILEVILNHQIPNKEYCNSVVEAAKEQVCYLTNF